VVRPEDDDQEAAERHWHPRLLLQGGKDRETVYCIFPFFCIFLILYCVLFCFHRESCVLLSIFSFLGYLRFEGTAERRLHWPQRHQLLWIGVHSVQLNQRTPDKTHYGLQVFVCLFVCLFVC
jgi:hypothetical protein